MLPTLPEGWQQRLVGLTFENRVTGWFLEPNDAAISKYVRAEPRDREWIWAGLEAGILSTAVIPVVHLVFDACCGGASLRRHPCRTPGLRRPLRRGIITPSVFPSAA